MALYGQDDLMLPSISVLFRKMPKPGVIYLLGSRTPNGQMSG